MSQKINSKSISWKNFIVMHSRAYSDTTYIQVGFRYWCVHWLQVLDLRQVWQGASVGKCSHPSPTSRTSTPCVGYGGGDGDVGAPLNIIYSRTKNTEEGKWKSCSTTVNLVVQDNQDTLYFGHHYPHLSPKSENEVYIIC